MITDSQAASLITIINSHHGGVTPHPMQAKLFAQEINPDATLDDCTRAIITFYRSHNGWCMPADINQILREEQAKRIPSENWIQQQARRLNILDGGAYWNFRRTVIRLTASGMEWQSATLQASHPTRKLSPNSGKPVARERGLKRVGGSLSQVLRDTPSSHS